MSEAFVARLTEIKIGTQTWTSKNLDVATYRNGDAIPQVQDFNEWKNLTTGAWCYLFNDPTNGTKYGKLYNWYAVTDPRGLAPEGYHIPTDEEWTILTDYLGGESAAGKKMKSTTGWKSYTEGVGSYDKTCPNCANWSELYRTQVACHRCKGTQVIPAYEPVKTRSGNGTNTSGFNSLPGGYRWADDLWLPSGLYGSWWSSSEGEPDLFMNNETIQFEKKNYTDYAWPRTLSNEPTIGSYLIKNKFHYKYYGLSVRCIKD